MNFRHPVTVRYADTDAQGHVFFANYLTYFDEAVTGYCAHVGVDYAALRALGVDLVYVDARCSWSGSIRFGDAVDVGCSFTRFGRTSITATFEVRARGETVATGTAVLVCTGGEPRQSVAVPEPLMDAVRRFEAG